MLQSLLKAKGRKGRRRAGIVADYVENRLLADMATPYPWADGPKSGGGGWWLSMEGTIDLGELIDSLGRFAKKYLKTGVLAINGRS